MAKCEQCVPEPVAKYSAKQQAPVPCSDCGAFPSYWWQPNNGHVNFK